MRTSARSLIGRENETHRIDALLGAAFEGAGGTLVLRGEAGIGKSALLGYAVDAAVSFRSIRASGSEFEAELPFAALHQLCVPILDGLDRLPPLYRDALRIAFGEASGAPDPLRIGMAVLHLLANEARSQPVLCVIDDAHWLDDASQRVMVFLARRISAERLAMIVAARHGLQELPSVELTGLPYEHARLLLSRSRAALDEQVRERLLAEAKGNPLALLELPHADGFALPALSSVPNRIEHSFAIRATELADKVKLLLTLASAEPTGDPDLLWAAADLLGLDHSIAPAAEESGLLTLATRVRFCHPLARSGVYRAAEVEHRLAAHQALATVTDPVADPDRRAWHRAQSGTGPNEEIALELARSAARASARGGVAATTAFLRRAAELSLDPAKRVERALGAVGAAIESGTLESAAELLSAVKVDDDDEVTLAHVALLRGRIESVRNTSDEGPSDTLRAAAMFAAHDPLRSRQCYLDAVERALVVGRAGGVRDVVLEAARCAPPSPGPADILDALIQLTTSGHGGALKTIRTILSTDAQWQQRPVLAAMLAVELLDYDANAAIVAWLVTTSRESGSTLNLRVGLGMEAATAVHSGDLGGALAAIAEEAAVADAVGGAPVVYHRLHLAALRGNPAELRTVMDTAMAQTPHCVLPNAHWAKAVLNNGMARYPAALAEAKAASTHSDLGVTGLALAEVVEAAVRCDDIDTATAALASLTDHAVAGMPWGLGITAYSRALATGVEDHYREAIEILRDSPLAPYRARAHLLYGEWLRRQHRRRDAREHLHSAHEELTAMGMSAFATRAAAELRAMGERARRRSSHTLDQLTEQEVHIARLVATGATSKDIAARLFLSPRTIDAHLRNIFRKLNITSRRQLRDIPGLAS